MVEGGEEVVAHGGGVNDYLDGTAVRGSEIGQTERAAASGYPATRRNAATIVSATFEAA